MKRHRAGGGVARQRSDAEGRSFAGGRLRASTSAPHFWMRFLSIVPVLLGGGEGLFEGVEADDIQLEQVRAIDAPGVTNIKYRVRHG
jgi:hypothetical protein